MTIPASDQIRVPGTVWYIINDNFALVETNDTKSLALFDTYDFYMTQNGTAAEAKQSLKQVVTVGMSVKLNACYISKDFSIPFLCTSIWKTGGESAGLDFEPLPKANIQPDKLNIHEQVSTSTLSKVFCQGGPGSEMGYFLRFKK